MNLSIPHTVDTWNGFTRYSFVIEDCQAWIVEPKTPAPGNPWSWCMEFPNAFTPRCAALKLMDNGYYHVHVTVGNTFGCPSAQVVFRRFYAFLQTLGLARKAVLIAISRGGLYAYQFAAKNPGATSVIYGDAPVCDFKSWPAGMGHGPGSADDWQKLKELYHFKNDLDAARFQGNPIDILPILAEQRISLIHVVGDEDITVPVDENTDVLQQRYADLGGTIHVIHKPTCGHHPHGLDDDSPVVAFILEHNP